MDAKNTNSSDEVGAAINSQKILTDGVVSYQDLQTYADGDFVHGSSDKQGSESAGKLIKPTQKIYNVQTRAGIEKATK